MRRILGLLILFLFSATLVYSLEGYTLEEIKANENFYNETEGTFNLNEIILDLEAKEEDPTALLPLLTEEEFVDNMKIDDVGVDLSTIKDEVIADPEIAEVKNTVVTALTDAGYTPEDIDTALDVAVDLSQGKTIAEIKEANPEAIKLVEDAIVAVVAEQIQEAILTPETQDQIRDSLDMLGSVTNVLKGFAQATANTSVASNLFAHQGYKLFAVSMGLNVSVAADDPLQNAMFIINNSSDTDKILDELEAKKVEAGLSLQSFSANVGINMSWLLDGLYLGAVLGSTAVEASTESAGEVSLLSIPIYTVEQLETEAEDPSMTLTMDSSIFGIRANYQLIDAFSIPVLFRWNGVNVGTGFIYTGFNINAELDVSPAIDVEKDTLGASVAISSSAITIPLEISTGIRLLSVVNLGIGLGADLQFGSSNFDVDLNFANEGSLISRAINETINNILEESDSGVEFPLSIEGAPSVFNPRASVGLGVGLGPITVDFIGTLYFQTGVAIGVNFTLRL